MIKKVLVIIKVIFSFDAQFLKLQGAGRGGYSLTVAENFSNGPHRGEGQGCRKLAEDLAVGRLQSDLKDLIPEHGRPLG